MTLLFISFMAGILTVLAPCVLPLLPVIVGGSLSGGKPDRRRALIVAASLSISVIAFTLLLKAGTLFVGIPESFWKIASGGIIVVFGFVTLFPELWDAIPLVSGFGRKSNEVLTAGYRRQNVWGDIVMGAALGPVFSSCSPTYFVVLATVLPQSFGLGFLYLAVYAAGLSLMLLFISLVGQRVLVRIGVAADPKGVFKKILGIVFIVVGIAVMTGYDKKFEAWLLTTGIFDVTRVEQSLLQLNNSQR